MGKLSIYLPPFAGDYSGVCSALFDFRCLIVLLDAGCCTKNYIDCDEPRWNRDKNITFSAQLRTLEVALGDESRVLGQTAEAAMEMQPDFIALSGSPVPAVTGMDMNGMARELEAKTGIPALGFHTTGFTTYWQGIELALNGLYRRFAEKNQSKRPDMVNLLGLTPLDFGANGNAAALRNAVEQAGFSVGCSFLMDCTLEQIRLAPAAAANLVVSASGLSLAREMEQTLGIPYVAALPLGEKGFQVIGDLLKQALKTGVSQFPAAFLEDADHTQGENGILLVGEQILTQSMRAALRAEGCTRPVVAASFFTSDPALTIPGDLYINREADLICALRSGRFTTLVGDPLLARIPDSLNLRLFSLPHPAVSGRLHWDEVPILTGKEMDHFLLSILSI